MKIIKKNTILAGLLTILSLNSFAGTVTPSASFGTATHVVVAQNGSMSVVMARNAKGDVFVGKAQYVAGQGTYYGTHETNAHVRSGVNGAVSNGTVKATITQQVQKRSVIDEMLKKAKIGGKMLGKGAATAARFAASNNPYIRAFSLVMLALEASNSGIKWDEDKAEFMRLNDDNTYVVLESSDVLYLGGTSSVVSSRQVNEQMIEATCNHYKCSVLGFETGSQNAYERALRYCQDNGFDSIGHAGYCQRGSMVSFSYGVIAYRYTGYTTVSEDYFYNEIEKEVDKNPKDFVEIADVKPTDEPKVEIKAGTIAQSDPYTDPKDKKVKQTRWEFDGNGNVREIVTERPDLTPNSPEAPELRLPADDNNGDKDKDGESEKDEKETEKEDLCEKNADILACDKQPEKLELDEFPEIPTEEVNLKFEPDSVFPNAGQCPSPVAFQAMGGTYQISTQPICDIAEKIRPFIIALAYLAAAFFVIRTIKSETA